MSRVSGCLPPLPSARLHRPTSRQPEVTVFLGPKALRGFSVMLVGFSTSHQKLQQGGRRPWGHPPAACRSAQSQRAAFGECLRRPF